MSLRAGVVGHPIGHTLSPIIFKFLSQNLGNLKLNYEAFDITTTEFAVFFNSLKSDKEFCGLNVTLPYKEKLLDFLDEISPEAKIIGAVNVVKFSEGKALGFNSDVAGIVDSLIDNNIDLSGQSVLLIGAGGVARAAAYAVAQLGASKIVLVNRDKLRAQKLAAEFSLKLNESRFVGFGIEQDLRAENFRLIIQATSVGMNCHLVSKETQEVKSSQFYDRIFENIQPRLGFAFDLIYRPENTAFLECARKNAYKAISGSSMLLAQALNTWELWFGPISNKSEIKKMLGEYMRAHLTEPI